VWPRPATRDDAHFAGTTARVCSDVEDRAAHGSLFRRLVHAPRKNSAHRSNSDGWHATLPTCDPRSSQARWLHVHNVRVVVCITAAWLFLAPGNPPPRSKTSLPVPCSSEPWIEGMGSEDGNALNSTCDVLDAHSTAAGRFEQPTESLVLAQRIAQ
jgi:hypothetical protein